MSYSNDNGFTPLTRSQMLTILFESAVKNGYSGSFQDFKGSNIHRIHSDTTLPYLETIQADFYDATMSMFSYFVDNTKAVYGSFGASYEGWQNNFANLARGLNLIDVTIDPSLGAPGNIAIYFDMLESEKNPKEVEDAFKQCIWPGMITPRGEHTFDVQFSASNGKKSYRYYNLHEDDYTKLDLKIHVVYKTRALEYEPEVIRQSVKTQFNAINRIGRSFYPESYFDHNALPNIRSMAIRSALAGTNNYTNYMREAAFGQKYILNMLEVIVDEQ